jgi:hypothetical protein
VVPRLIAGTATTEESAVNVVIDLFYTVLDSIYTSLSSMFGSS